MNDQVQPHHHDPARSEQFVSSTDGHSGRSLCVHLRLVRWSQDATDVLQETNLVLWRRAHEFDTEKTFTALAYRVAYIQVLAHRKKQAHDRHIFNFSEDRSKR